MPDERALENALVSATKRVTVKLDVGVVATLREHAAAGQVSEGEIVERVLRAADLRALVGRARGRSDLDGTRRCVSPARS